MGFAATNERIAKLRRLTRALWILAASFVLAAIACLISAGELAMREPDDVFDERSLLVPRETADRFESPLPANVSGSPLNGTPNSPGAIGADGVRLEPSGVSDMWWGTQTEKNVQTDQFEENCVKMAGEYQRDRCHAQMEEAFKSFITWHADGFGPIERDQDHYIKAQRIFQQYPENALQHLEKMTGAWRPDGVHLKAIRSMLATIRSYGSFHGQRAVEAKIGMAYMGSKLQSMERQRQVRLLWAAAMAAVSAVLSLIALRQTFFLRNLAIRPARTARGR